MKKQLVIAGALTAIGLSTVVGVGLASAQSTSSTSSTGVSSLVDKIATKFGLNKADVQQVFDQDKTDRQAAREAEIKTKLDQAVKDGKLTQAQEDALIAKFKEMKADMEANRAALKDKTEAERHAAMKTKMDNFKQWLTDNKIPDEYAHLGMGGGHGGPGGPGMDGPPPDSSSSSSSSSTTTN